MLSGLSAVSISRRDYDKIDTPETAKALGRFGAPGLVRLNGTLYIEHNETVADETVSEWLRILDAKAKALGIPA